jgi:hypothetical protein
MKKNKEQKKEITNLEDGFLALTNMDRDQLIQSRIVESFSPEFFSNYEFANKFLEKGLGWRINREQAEKLNEDVLQKFIYDNSDYLIGLPEGILKLEKVTKCILESDQKNILWDHHFELLNENFYKDYIKDKEKICIKKNTQGVLPENILGDLSFHFSDFVFDKTVKTIGKNLYIASSKIKGLRNLKTVKGEISISYSANLCLPSLVEVGGLVSITKTKVKFKKLKKVNTLLVCEQKNGNAKGFQDIEEIDGHLYVHKCDGVNFDSLQRVGGCIVLCKSNNITFKSLKNINNIKILDSTNFSLPVVENIESITSSYISDYHTRKALNEHPHLIEKISIESGLEAEDYRSIYNFLKINLS